MLLNSFTLDIKYKCPVPVSPHIKMEVYLTVKSLASVLLAYDERLCIIKINCTVWPLLWIYYGRLFAVYIICLNKKVCPIQVEEPHWYCFTRLSRRSKQQTHSRLSFKWINMQLHPHCLHSPNVYLCFETVCQADSTIATRMKWKGDTVFLCCWVML